MLFINIIGGILVLFVYIRRLLSMEIFSPSKKYIGKQVGLRTYQHPGKIPNHNDYWNTPTATDYGKCSATFDCEKPNRIQMAVPTTSVRSRIQSLTHNPFKTSHVCEKIYAQLFTFQLNLEACILTVHPSIYFVTLL